MERVLIWAAGWCNGGRSRPLSRSLGAARCAVASLEALCDEAGPYELLLVPDHMLVRYIDAAHGWLAALLGELQTILVHGSTTGDAIDGDLRSLGRFSTFFVLDHLEILHTNLEPEWSRPPLSGAAELSAAQARLHGDIAWLNCELGARE